MEDILVKIATILDIHYQEDYVDEDFFQAIFDDVVNLQGTREYVCNGLSVGEKAPMLFASAAYDLKEKKIKIFSLSRKLAEYDVHVFIKDIPENKKIYATNMLLVVALLHELEHVNQSKLKETSDSYEAQLLRCEDGNVESTSTYDLIPSERFAESKALASGLKILNYSTQIVPELESYLEERRNLALICGYEDPYNRCQSYPIKRYMEHHSINYSEMSVQESIQTEPDLETRLFYGMPITNEEYRAVRTRAGLKNSSNAYSA